MNKLVLSPHFKKSYKKFVRRNYQLQEQIDSALILLEKDIYDYRLRTHKLSGELFGCLACSCGFDCRIIFKVMNVDGEQNILLISIGTHEEVY